MANLIVGSKECTLSEVVLSVEASTVALTLFNDWRKFARVLGTSQITMENLAQDLILNKKGKTEVIEVVLLDWVSRTGHTATLGALLSLVEKHFKLASLNDLFRGIIKSKAVAWNDLDEQSKREILECPLQFLGRTTTLLKIRNKLGISKTIELLQNLLKEGLFNNLKCGTTCKLDSIQEGKKLPYYIQRTLLMQRQLDPKIFKENCTDVFVVQGIQRSRLSILASPEKTELSGNQVHEITHRFILLECDNDFGILAKKISPIHRIEFVKGNFFWISTTGSVDVIRKHLMGEVEEISENEMVTQKLSIYNSRPIAIAECPGMGKTILLSEIARQVAQQYPERYVLSIFLLNLFSSMESDRGQMLNLTFLKRSLANSSSSSSLGREIIFEVMNCEEAKFEVFLDAFDEIPSSQIQRVEQMLELLLHSNNLRVFITSRTYMRDSLEQRVGLISWNIQPFSPTDQTNFFVRYWTIKFNLDNTTRVQEFACDLVKHLQSHEIFSGEDDANVFVGIPIKCFVLAELYSTDALRHVTSISPHPGISFKFSTLCGMYQEFLALRLQKIPDTQKAAVKQALWLTAIQLLFPSWSHKLKELLTEPFSSSIDTKLLLSVGILHCLDPPKFIHRTLAEFLVADFIVSNLLKKQSESCGIKFVDFLFGSVFASLTSTHGVQLSQQIVQDFASVLESSTVWSQIDTEFKNLTGALGLEKYYHVDRGGKERTEYLKDLLTYYDMEHGNAALFLKLINLLRNKTQWPPDVMGKYSS